MAKGVVGPVTTDNDAVDEIGNVMTGSSSAVSIVTDTSTAASAAETTARPTQRIPTEGRRSSGCMLAGSAGSPDVCTAILASRTSRKRCRGSLVRLRCKIWRMCGTKKC